MSSSAAPRISCERITPELPRAPSSAARATDCDDLLAPDLVDRALAVGHQAVELGEHGAQREHHVVAGVAVGDREHVEVVDLLAARLQMGERAGDGGPEADQVGVGHGAPMMSARPAGVPAPGAEALRAALVTLPALRQRVHT